MRRFLAVIAFVSVAGCSSLANIVQNPTVVAVVDGIRTACGWEANSAAVQALLNAGIPGLTTIQNYVGAFCAAAANAPVAAARAGGPQAVIVGGVAIPAQRVVK